MAPICRQAGRERDRGGNDAAGGDGGGAKGMKPLCIDLFCGLGGWSEGFLAEGYRCVGYDIEAHEYWVPDNSAADDGSKGTKPVEKRGWTQGCAVSLGMEGATKQPCTKLLKYPGTLILRDVLSIHGSEFKDAAVIVASPPCQKYSYMAMPWKRAKAQAKAIREDLTGKKLEALNELFNECFRLQREASEAAGHHIPLIIENVRGAQPWVGPAKWNYGSFYLWGDVPALMPMTFNIRTSKTPPSNGAGAPLWKDRPMNSLSHATLTDESQEWYGLKVPSENGRRTDVGNGARFTTRDCGIDGRKVAMNFHEHEKTGKPARSFQSAAVEEMGIKEGDDWWNKECRKTGMARFGSKSNARKMASAMIAKIPLPLALHIARTFKP
jgi:hypothetical protein